MPPKATKTEVLTKVSMVKIAIEVLGPGAEIDEYVAFIKQRFGPELAEAVSKVPTSVLQWKLTLARRK